MPAAALAEVTDLEDRLGREITTDSERARAEAALDDASALVREEGRPDWTSQTVPQAVVAVVLTAALRVMRNPEGFASEQIGAYSYQRAYGEALGVYLSDAEKAIVRRYRNTRSAGLWTQPTTRGEEWDETLWATTYPTGYDPFPLDNARDFGWYG